jgi:hypothetical protein
MSINDATPADWNRLRREHPAIVKYADAAQEEANEIYPQDNDSVNHPGHYTQGNIECIDAIKESMSTEAWRGFLKGQVFKYVWRESLKHDSGGQECLLKAEFYLKRLISSYQEQ